MAAYPPVVLAIIHLTRVLRATEAPVERGRLWTLRLGAIVSVLGGTSDFIPSLGLNVYPMGVVGNIGFVAIATFAVTRYRLMNLRLAARRGLAYTAVSAFIFAAYGVTFLALQYVWQDLTLTARIFAAAALVVLVGVFIQPLFSRVQVFVDRIFFRERLDRVHALGRLNELTKDITDLPALAQSFVDTVRRASQADWVGLALLRSDAYKLVLAADTRKPAPAFELPAGGTALMWFTRPGAVLQPWQMSVDPVLQAMSAAEREALEGLGAGLILPMASKGTLTGLLILGPRLVGPGYRKEDIEFLRATADQAAVAVESARLYAASLQEAKERSALAELAKVVGSTLDLNTVLERCATEVRQLLPADRLSIALVDPEQKMLRCEYASDASGVLQAGVTMPLAGSPVEHVVLSQTNSIMSMPATTHPRDGETTGYRSVLAMPLISNSQTIAVMVIESSKEYAYGQSELELAGHVGAHLANAIANSNLYAQALQLAREQELRARAEAEKRELQRVNEVKSKFLSTVSHELKTPLTSMLAFTDILLRNRSGALSEREIQHLEVIRRNGRRLSLLINDLLDVSRIDAGTLKLVRNEFDIRELLEELEESFTPIFEAKRQTLALAIPPEPLFLFADRERIAQVVSNLLSNASKYSPVETRVEIQASYSDERVAISVKDEGVGISPEDQKRLFTSFFRADNDVTRAVPGTGLGLVIAKGIVELHGGKVVVSSVPGKGTTVIFDLPQVQPEEDAMKGAA
jgi:signal transduction histidine kinase